ncbi:uncharacterized protein LOC115749212 [Rhodamnia argentea]|uniref:Uncharacterized protein LOC115749212 n=1 Tax=Rhodamnia argentea TaxID=178133 RepID=A0ABM3HBK6_9MYRT|nr:uncharacterized protein LOC115749212 [Rhodamnia argentea]
MNGSSLQEITDLFASLASHLETLDRTCAIGNGGEGEDAGRSLDAAISKLNRSLNLHDGDGDGDEDPAVRFLDTALSLMCFKAPQVFGSVVDYTVKTIAAVLSSSIGCEVVRFRKEEALQIGSSISHNDCVQVVAACSDILPKLQRDGTLSHLLLHAVLRVAVSASHSRFLFPLARIVDVKSVSGRIIAASKLLDYLPKGFCLKDDETPSRLLFWYLDPAILSNDISKILQEVMERPFLCLHKELHERMSWRNIVACLVLSPIMFFEAKALLHRWFLETGLAFVLEFSTILVKVILDVISRPMWWGISMETGMKLPFSDAYFPFHHQLLRSFMGPISCATLLNLVDFTSNKSSTANSDVTKAARIDSQVYVVNTMMAHAINFPVWFYFASLTLLCDESLHMHCTFGQTHTTDQMQNTKPLSGRTAAARYIAWILCPINIARQELLVDHLIKLSESWAVNQFSSGVRDVETAVLRKKLKKPRLSEDNANNNLKEEEHNCRSIENLVEDFQNLYRWYCTQFMNFRASCEGQSIDGCLQQSMMFREIPLGILIGQSSFMEEDVCELLLHYASTGRILQPGKTKKVELKDIRSYSEGPVSAVWNDDCVKEEAIRGARLIFELTDIVENMSSSMCETEESELGFICRLKERTVGYLVKCIKSLIQLETFEGKSSMLLDLHRRLLQWKHNGRKQFKVPEDLDHITLELNHQLSTT